MVLTPHRPGVMIAGQFCLKPQKFRKAKGKQAGQANEALNTGRTIEKPMNIREIDWATIHHSNDSAFLARCFAPLVWESSYLERSSGSLFLLYLGLAQSTPDHLFWLLHYTQSGSQRKMNMSTASATPSFIPSSVQSAPWKE